MKVLFITNIPSPYRVSFFNELGKYCNLTVLFEKKASEERNDSWEKYVFKNFIGIFLKGKSVSVDSAFCPSVIKYVKDKSFDHIICSTFSSPTGILAIEYMKRHHIAYWLESDGGIAKNGKGFKEKLKKHIISGANGYFSTGNEHDNYYLAYGARREQLHRYPFTSLLKKDIISEHISESEKTDLRRKLGMSEEKIILSVGRFSYLNGYGKGYDVVMKVASRLPKEYGFYIIGDSPTEEFINMREKLKATNVHFIDFKNKNELKLYYRASDLFVLMTIYDVWGLVINEAMANGLPIITTDKCVAGLELIKNGENGYIVPVGDDDELENRILEILLDKELLIYMSNNNLKKIQSYTIEKVTQEHLRILNIK
ncbi:hypothetical protein B5F08_11400 [Anaeromassilibacillus sp. An172]|uniref:glycosyltransferase family 4 protein n=1 Tax=Anaeromassilibacillus sp. An172 TaxID=1965570 RepID=UPI000B36FB66|nr:glycosyltransferase family 4 protein [Anaeromassilibacillus sp. An172]OUP75313.1 hypothetical protein B5F08_11400 [Anaeromassilibacillus sp. An172]